MITQPQKTPNQSQAINQLSLALEKSNRDRKNFVNRVDTDRFLPNIALYNQINASLTTYVSSLREASINSQIDLSHINPQVAAAAAEKLTRKKIDQKQEKKLGQTACAKEMADSFMQSSIDKKMHTLLTYLISKSKNPIPSPKLKKVIEKGLFGATKKLHTPEQIEASLNKLLKDKADLIKKYSYLNIASTLKKKLELEQSESPRTKNPNDYAEEKTLKTENLKTKAITYLELDTLSQSSFITENESSSSADESTETAFYSAKSTEISNNGSGMPTLIFTSNKRPAIIKNFEIINLNFVKKLFFSKAKSQGSTHTDLSRLSEQTLLDPQLQRFSKFSEMNAQFRNEM